jgi:predicted hydrocarbon binding protein
MQEYGEENNIKIWTLENFKNAFETINVKIRTEGEMRLEGNSLLYTIKKCNIVGEGNELDIYVCHTIREMFKGALNFAFRNKAQLQVKKLLTHGDKLCEVVIRVQ